MRVRRNEVSQCNVDHLTQALKMKFLPVMDNVGDNGSKQAQQHNCSTCIYHRVQELPWVLGERQHCLKILWRKENDLNIVKHVRNP